MSSQISLDLKYPLCRRCSVMECICEILVGGGWFLYMLFYIHMQYRLDKSHSAKSENSKHNSI